MMGQHDRSESLFYYFRLEDHVPENHLLRLIDRHISFLYARLCAIPTARRDGLRSIQWCCCASC